MKKYLIHFLFCIQIFSVNAQQWKYSSGDDEIDAIRIEMKSVPTSVENYTTRGMMMKLWAVALQHQGLYLTDRYVHIDTKMREIDNYNPVFTGGYGDKAQIPKTDVEKYCLIIDEGLLILDSIQRDAIDNPELYNHWNKKVENPSKITPPKKENINWPHYKGNSQRTGHSGADGPVYGRMAWKIPAGLRWESAPVIDNGIVYLSSPGMRNIMFKLDLESGNVLETYKQSPELKIDQLFGTPAISSTPILLKDHIVLRELGSRGNKGIAKDVVFVNRETGKIDREVEAGHIDYKVGYAPVAANEKYLVFPYSVHDIELRPPVCQPFNRIICKDINTGIIKWDFNVGHLFGEPNLDDDRIYIGTQAGYVYCLKAEGDYKPSSAERIAWEFKTEGSVNKKVEVDDKYAYFGCNKGGIYCVDKFTGKEIWRYKVEDYEKRAYRHFSTPLSTDDLVFVGSANKNVFCFEKESGKLIQKIPSTDYVRSRPVFLNNHLVFASMDGYLNCYSYNEGSFSKVWSKQFNHHNVYANLAASGDKIVFNDADLYSFCVDLSGELVWKHSIIKGFYQEDGYRIQTDQIAGGAYYEGKPTAADGKVFFGIPSGFIICADAETGEEKWKFETASAVCSAPVFYKNRVYAGQQGGDDAFYCLDANTGEVIWKQNIGWVWGSCNISDGKVYVPGIDGYVNCLDAETGAILWRYRTDRSTCGEPLILGEHVFFGGWDHFLYKFNKHTGEPVWKFQLSGGSDSGAPIGYGNQIFLPVGGASFRCLNADTKEVLWTPKVEAAVFNATPAYHDKKVFISKFYGKGLGGVPVGSAVLALDSDNGEKIWQYEGGGALTGPVVGNNNRVYFASTVNPYFHCVDEKGNDDGTTNLLWSVRMENKTEESVPAIYNGKAYIICSGGYLYAIE